MDKTEKRKLAAFRLPESTLKRLRLWCAMRGVDQASTVDTCVRMWLDHLLARMDAEFRDAFEAAVEQTDIEPEDAE